MFVLLCGVLPARAAPGCGAGARRRDHRSRCAARTRPRADLASAAVLSAGAIRPISPLDQRRAVRLAVDGAGPPGDRRRIRSLRREAQSRVCPAKPSASATAFDFQLFDRAQLYSADTRFVLAGIVNRMDRAYVSRQTCGEIRLIYRLTRTDGPSRSRRGRGLAAAADDAQRRAAGERRDAIDADGIAVTCAEIARRWLAAGEWPLTGADARRKTDWRRAARSI